MPYNDTNAERVYNNLFKSVNTDLNLLEKYTVLTDADTNPKLWPTSDGFDRGLVVTIIDLYHDLVTNKNYPLPNTPENIRTLTAKIRKDLGLTLNSPRGLAPTNVILAMNKHISTANNDLYPWLYPTILSKKALEEKEKESKENPINKGLNDAKWILGLGLATYIIIQTGVLKK
jgi:hypothetical protein